MPVHTQTPFATWMCLLKYLHAPGCVHPVHGRKHRHEQRFTQPRHLHNTPTAGNVCAGTTTTSSTTARRVGLSLAVAASTTAPACFACCASASTVLNQPGPADTNNRSPAPSGGHAMSPTQLHCRPAWWRRMARPRMARPSRPTP